MSESYFAIFDDTGKRLKIVMMSEILPEPSLTVRLSPYTRRVQRRTYCRIEPCEGDTSMVKRIPLEHGDHL